MNIHEEQVRKFYSEIWNQKNFAEIPYVLHENFTFRGSLDQKKRGFEEFKSYANYVYSGLSSYKCIIEDLVVEAEKVFTKMIFTGVHHSEFLGYPPTGKQVSWAGAALFTFTGKKVSDLWVLGDLKNLEQQLDNRI